MQTIEEIISWIKSSPDVTSEIRTEPPPYYDVIERLPEDVKTYYHNFENLTIFNRGNCNRWSLSRFPSTLQLLSNWDRGGLQTYYEKCFLIAYSATSGEDLVVMDFHPEQKGAIFILPDIDTTPALGLGIIARNFTEWLDRIIQAGPDAGKPYWRQPGFVSYGPVIPNDPNYIEDRTKQ